VLTLWCKGKSKGKGCCKIAFANCAVQASEQASISGWMSKFKLSSDI